MKPTKATIQQRVDEIHLIRLQGATGVEVRQYVADRETAGEQPWTVTEGGKPLSERSLWRYIQRADEEIKESCRESRKRRLVRHLSQRRYLYSLAVSQADPRAALAALDSEAKLLGMFAPSKTELSGQGILIVSGFDAAAALGQSLVNPGGEDGGAEAEQAE